MKKNVSASYSENYKTKHTKQGIVSLASTQKKQIL